MYDILASKLEFGFIYSIGNPSRNRDIIEKPVWLIQNPCALTQTFDGGLYITSRDAQWVDNQKFELANFLETRQIVKNT